MKVMIVDDDIPTTQVIKQSIDWKLFSVTEVIVSYNAKTARTILDEKQPELVLSDIEMPKGSGLDILHYAREKKYNCQFIFLTCHADFSYVSEALRYEAVDYQVKPFDTVKAQAAVAKAIERIAYQKEQDKISCYKEQWLSSKGRREADFWRDLLFSRFPSEPPSIEKALADRQVQIEDEISYSIALSVVKKDDAAQNGWDEPLFCYALHNLAAEIMTGETDSPLVLHYARNGRYYVLSIIPAKHRPDDLHARINRLIAIGKTYFHCEVTTYLKDEIALENLCDTREKLEIIDKKNVCNTGVLLANEEMEAEMPPVVHQIDLQKIEQLLREERGTEAINFLREGLESLMDANQLNYENLHQIHEDYIQIVYTVLYNNNIQAHELFSDTAMQKLFSISEDSVFDLMKWASGITEKMLAYQKEIRKTETVIDMIKHYIAENYGKDISRNEIAASVFLSPDYVSKLFRVATGVHLKDYVNDVRIKKAKELLIDDSITVSEAASFVGMDNFSYFSTLFKKTTGLSPREYKQTAKSNYIQLNK